MFINDVNQKYEILDFFEMAVYMRTFEHDNPSLFDQLLKKTDGQPTYGCLE